VDEVIEEPLGGAHRDPDETARRLRQALLESLELLERTPLDRLLDQRQQRLMGYGEYRLQ